MIQRCASRFWVSSAVMVALAAMAEATMADDAETGIRVLSYNVRYASPGDGRDVWANRVDAVAETIREADAAGLQEVTFPQLQDLRDRLPEYDWYGVGREDGQRGGEFSPVCFRRQRFRVVDRGTFWLSPKPEEAGSRGWDAALPRILSWVVLEDERSGREFRFGSTHFDHRGVEARRESARLIRRRLQRVPSDQPVILAGDFNCGPGSEPYQALVRPGVASAGAFRDARDVGGEAVHGPESTWNGFTQIVPGRIIDHVFVAGPVRPVRLEVGDPKTEAGRFASDHLPVFASVKLTE